MATVADGVSLLSPIVAYCRRFRLDGTGERIHTLVRWQERIRTLVRWQERIG